MEGRENGIATVSLKSREKKQIVQGQEKVGEFLEKVRENPRYCQSQ